MVFSAASSWFLTSRIINALAGAAFLIPMFASSKFKGYLDVVKVSEAADPRRPERSPALGRDFKASQTYLNFFTAETLRTQRELFFFNPVRGRIEESSSGLRPEGGLRPGGPPANKYPKGSEAYRLPASHRKSITFLLCGLSGFAVNIIILEN